FDVGAAALERLVEPRTQRDVAWTDAERGRERERQTGAVHRGLHRPDVERHSLAGGEVSGERPPDDRDVHLPRRHGVNQRGGWVRRGVIAVDAVTDHVADDAAERERVGGRRVLVIVADEVDPDPEPAERGIVERIDGEVAVAPGEEYVGGPIV